MVNEDEPEMDLPCATLYQDVITLDSDSVIKVPVKSIELHGRARVGHGGNGTVFNAPFRMLVKSARCTAFKDGWHETLSKLRNACNDNDILRNGLVLPLEIEHDNRSSALFAMPGDEDNVRYCMPLVRGRTLNDCYYDDELPNGQSYETLRDEFVNILKALHDAGFYHNDLKSNNVMLDESDPSKFAIKIIDLDNITKDSVDPAGSPHICIEVDVENEVSKADDCAHEIFKHLLRASGGRSMSKKTPSKSKRQGSKKSAKRKGSPVGKRPARVR